MRRSFVIVAVLLVGSGVAFAQDSGSNGGSGGPRVRIGGSPDDESGERAPTRDPQPERAERSEADKLIEELATWPSKDARQASIRLAAQPTTAFPLLDGVMRSSDADWKQICGAAATLGRIRDTRALEMIESRIQDKRLYQHSADLLDALTKIDPIGAKNRLLAHLLHPASAVVGEARTRLEKRVGPDDVDALREILDIGGTAARQHTLELLRMADAEAARPDLATALRDSHAPTAIAAARGLATDDAPEALDLLRRSALSPLDRQMAYAYIGIALRAERSGDQLLTAADVRALSGGRGVGHPDRLNRAAAAIALADAGYYHEVEGLDRLLESTVAPALIDAWVNPEYWKDMKVVQPLVLRRLRRVTGHHELREPREWGAWWMENRDSFIARRVLARVDVSDIGTMLLAVTGVDAPGGETTLLGGSADVLGVPLEGELALLLPEDAAVELATLVNSSGLLRAGERDGPRFERQGELAISIRSGNRERRVLVDAAPTGAAEVLARVADLRSQYTWQRYRGVVGMDFATFVDAFAPHFAPDVPPANRDASLARLIVDSLQSTHSEDFMLASLNQLAALDGLESALEDQHVDRLLALLGRREKADEVARKLLQVIAHTHHEEAEPLLIDFVLTRPSHRRREILVELFGELSDEQIRRALAANEPVIRAAALEALTTESLEGEGSYAARIALEDEDMIVRASAVRALGRLRDENARERVEKLAREDGELRVAALEALGNLGGKSSLPIIMRAFAHDDPALRIAAVDAFASCGEPEGLSAIVFAMTGDPSSLVREVSNKAILRIGTHRAADELRKLAIDPGQPAGPRARAISGLAVLRGKEAAPDLRRLVADPATEVGDEAALALADWRDAEGIARLIEMLESKRSTTRARRALESLSLEAFGQSDHEMLAALYAGWWEMTKEEGRGPRGWVVEGLRAEGVTNPALDAWEKGQAGRAVVPVLIGGMRARPWYVRNACNLALRDMLGRNVGDIEPFSSERESQRMADEWTDIWAEITGSSTE